MAFTPSDWNEIQDLSDTQLADCPWPIAGSHCSPCTIYRPSGSPYQMVFNIWGEFAGDATRQRYYAQTACTDYSPIMRFACQVGRFRTTAVPTNDGLFIGLVTQAVLNDTAKLHDPSQWQWAGYLATLTGGTPVVPSWLCVDVNLAWTPTTPLFLLMCTNGSYEVCGWDMCGYTDTSFPQAQPLYEWSYNEPNKPNGWTAMDNRYKGAFHIYSPPAGQLIEGHSHIASPNFPTTAIEGTPYTFSFTQTNENAFPCGCPETMVWILYNRDTSQPIMNEVAYALECGYTGASGVGGTITFSGGGTFHGQLKAGHKEGTTTVYDSTYDFDITVTPLPCTNWTTQSTCTSHGCYWWSGSCHSSQPTACSQLNNQTDCAAYGCYWYNNTCNSSPPPCSYYTSQSTCQAAGCYWWNGSCQSSQPTACSQLNNQTDCLAWSCYWYNNTCNSSPPPCSYYTTQSACTAAGCYWWNGSCQSSPPQCSDLNNQTECLAYSCYWYDNSCHSTPQQTGICQWITAHGGATGLDVTEVFQIIDSYVLQTPPTGYSFIPTITQVMGIIDYYLGFIASGNEKTGCVFSSSTVSLVQFSPSDGTCARAGIYADKVASISATFANDVTVGNLMVAVVSVWSYLAMPPNPTFSDDKGNVWQIDKVQDNGDSQKVIIASAYVTTGGNVKVTASESTAEYIWNMTIYEINGAATSSWVDGTNGNFGTGTAASTNTSSPGAGNRYYFAFMNYQGSPDTTITPDDTSWAQKNEDENSNYPTLNVCTITGSGNKSLSWTLGTSMIWAAAIVAYKEG